MAATTIIPSFLVEFVYLKYHQLDQDQVDRKVYNNIFSLLCYFKNTILRLFSCKLVVLGCMQLFVPK